MKNILDKLTADQLAQLIERVRLSEKTDLLDTMEYCLVNKLNYEKSVSEMMEIFNGIKIKVD